VIIPAPIRLCAIGPAVSPDVSALGKEWGIEFVGSGAPGGSASASSTASPVSCPSPISVSTSPENVTSLLFPDSSVIVPSSRRVNRTSVGKVGLGRGRTAAHVPPPTACSPRASALAPP